MTSPPSSSPIIPWDERSKITLSGSAAGLSILLIATMTGILRLSAS